MLTKVVTASVVISSVLFSLPTLAAQFNVTGIDTGSFSDGPDSTINGITYQNQSLPITGITANSIDYFLNTLPEPELTLRRSGGGTNPGRQLVWSERPSSIPQTTVRIARPTLTETVLEGNNLFAGTDNLFVNAGNNAGNQSDVERADFVVSNGFIIKPGQGAVVFERGASNVHDGFKIAAITAINGAGTPTAFGNLVQIPTGWGTTPLRVSTQTPPPNPTPNPTYTVLNNSGPGGAFTNTSNITNQNIGGVLVTLDTLRPQGTRIYGWALFGSDVTDGGNPNNLVNWTNATFFPRNSIENTTQGGNGIDLLASNVGVVSETIPEPITILGSIVVLGFGAFMKGQKNSKNK